MKEDLSLLLEPIIEPTAIGWLPLAIGWWFVIGCLMLLILIALIFFAYRNHSNSSYRQQAKKALKQLQQIDNPQTFANAINRLLKRTAIAGYGAHMAASLSGEQWLRFLDLTINDTLFCSPLGRLMLHCSYGKQIQQKLPKKQLIACCHHWIVRHKAIDGNVWRNTLSAHSTAEPPTTQRTFVLPKK